MNRAADRGVLR